MKKKEEKLSKSTAANISFLTAALFYLAAILLFLSKGNKTLACIYLCFGSTWLCLGATKRKQGKNRKSEDEKKQK